MSYRDSLDRVNSLLKFGIKPGLERVGELLARLGNPQDRLKFIHVAGTNGKGSVSTMLSCILHQAGYKTGMFTSPYVIDFRERMQINGKMIAHDELEQAIEAVMEVIEKMAAENLTITEFEAVTAIAMYWFAKKKCDVVVLEVGLGGRFDATNIISTPLASVICSISLDHTAILGDTVEEIAFEKCGIIKPNGITVTYPAQNENALRVIMQRAAEENNTLIMGNINAAEVIHEDIFGTSMSYGSLNIHIPLAGRHQVANAVTVIETAKALRNLGIAIRDEHIIAGVASAGIPARIEILCHEPLVILDGAHNADGTAVLAQTLRDYLPGRKIIAVMGMMADKDYRSAAASVLPLCSAVITVTPTNPRALSAQELAEVAKNYCDDVTPEENFKSALKLALEKTEKEDALLICGSLYLAGDMREMTLKKLKSVILIKIFKTRNKFECNRRNGNESFSCR